MIWIPLVDTNFLWSICKVSDKYLICFLTFFFVIVSLRPGVLNELSPSVRKLWTCFLKEGLEKSTLSVICFLKPSTDDLLESTETLHKRISFLQTSVSFSIYLQFSFGLSVFSQFLYFHPVLFSTFSKSLLSIALFLFWCF